MAKIAARELAVGSGWSVAEVVCSLGPGDRPFEERHAAVSIALVAAGTFAYRSHAGAALMTPGSLLLGGAGQSFECSHEHGTGDRCIAFSYAPEYFDRLDAEPRFRALRIPPLRETARLAARAEAVAGSWEELAAELAGRAVELSRGCEAATSVEGSDRVARLVRAMDAEPDAPHDLDTLARAARLSPYHFLRLFRRVAGVTPHQYVLRRRLHRAAERLAAEPGKILEIALDCGFGALSNFNRTFRAEFGASPRAWRRAVRRDPSVPAERWGPAPGP